MNTIRLQAFELGYEKRLSGAAKRLLACLEETGAYAVEDPTLQDTVIVRTENRGISLGVGQFGIKAAEELARRDLVSLGETGNGRRTFRISQPGRAYLRRQTADPEIAFLAQHQDLKDTEADIRGERTRVVVDAAESPLEWLRRRRDRYGAPLVDETCFQAGERLRRDLTFAAMLPSITSSWDPVANAGRNERGRDPAAATDTAIAARQRVTAAFREIGADLADILIDVCGFLKGLEQIERERGWPPRSAKIVINLALARLADHYGYERSARGPALSQGIRAWRALVADGDDRLD